MSGELVARVDLDAHLARIRERLSPPRAWTREAMARDESGRPVMPSSPAACRWCLVGAYNAEVETVAPDSPERSRVAVGLLFLLHAAARDLYGAGALSWFNDDERTTHEMVLAVVDGARSMHDARRCEARMAGGSRCVLPHGHERAREEYGMLVAGGGTAMVDSTAHLGQTEPGAWESWR